MYHEWHRHHCVNASIYHLWLQRLVQLSGILLSVCAHIHFPKFPDIKHSLTQSTELLSGGIILQLWHHILVPIECRKSRLIHATASPCFLGTFIRHFNVFSRNLYWKEQKSIKTYLPAEAEGLEAGVQHRTCRHADMQTYRHHADLTSHS